MSDHEEIVFLHSVIRDMRIENRIHGHITDASAKYIRRYPERMRDVVTPELTPLDCDGRPAIDSVYWRHCPATGKYDCSNNDGCESQCQTQMHKIKQRSYTLDPDCWISYSGKPRQFKRSIDARRTHALEEARKQIEKECAQC